MTTPDTAERRNEVSIIGTLRSGLHRLVARLRRNTDRGDTPVPSAIIIAGLAVLALTLVGWVFYLGGEFMGQVGTDLPDPPSIPGN